MFTDVWTRFVQHEDFLAAVVVGFLFFRGIVEAIGSVASEMRNVSRLLHLWHDEWHKQYGPPEPRYPSNLD